MEEVFTTNSFSFERFTALNWGVTKPLEISELNADGDVTGANEQATMVQDFYLKVKNKEALWLQGINMYQFRDRGRLGLEIEDPNNFKVGIEQPLLYTYRKLISDPYFQPKLVEGEAVELPYRLRWGSAEDAEGLSLPLFFTSNPVFCEVSFVEEDLNLMIEVNGRWFYKKPGVKSIDLMPAFYDQPLTGSTELTLKFFAPPTNGENDSTQGADWEKNYYCTIHQAPSLRIRYEPIELGEFKENK